MKETEKEKMDELVPHTHTQKFDNHNSQIRMPTNEI